MKSFLISGLFIFANLFVLNGCGGGTVPENKPANTANTTKPSNANANSAVAVITPTPSQTTNNAPTLTPIFKQWCTAKIKHDDAALRKVYSSDTIKSLESQMKEQKIKSIAEFLEDDKVSEKLCEVRNEQINGDTAIAEIRYDSAPNGIPVVFVKENGEWKITTRSPTIDSLQKSGNAPTSNSAK